MVFAPCGLKIEILSFLVIQLLIKKLMIKKKVNSGNCFVFKMVKPYGAINVFVILNVTLMGP